MPFQPGNKAADKGGLSMAVRIYIDNREQALAVTTLLTARERGDALVAAVAAVAAKKAQQTAAKADKE